MKRLACFLMVMLCAAVFPVAAAADTAEILFLTVSDICFSVVGESENIYAGTMPAENVQWESEDASVISVENGVLTAQSVGTTVIRASYDGQSVECTAGCLAEDRDALLLLPKETLQQPKRIPPKVEIDPTVFFGDAAMIGDSVTCNLLVHETKTNLLGHPLFMARKNIGVHNFLNHIINLTYQGLNMPVEKAVAASGVKKAFFLLGMNDIAYQTPEECAGKYATLIDRIQENAPDTTLYIQSTLPAYNSQLPFCTHNANIDAFNALVAQICAEKGCVFIDLAAYIEDHINSMALPYSLDYDVHMNYEGSVVWMDVLRAYAYLEECK